MSYVSTSEKTKIIKAALAKVYGNKNVSVRKGTGTASGWIHATVITADASHNNRLEIEIIAKKALREHGTEFFTYLSDDGFNDNYRDCFLVQIEKPEVTTA